MNQFLEDLELESGQPISRCFQCKKCSGGCPVSSLSGIMAHQVIRLAQLGRDKELLSTAGIWYCVGCKTCLVRCPNGIDVSAVLDVVRARLLGQGDLALGKLPAFHQSFLSSVRRHGRVYELGMVVGYKWRVRQWTEDKELGIKMLLKGKLALLPHRIHNRRQVERIFEQEKRGGSGNE